MITLSVKSKTSLALLTTVVLWSSSLIGIRIGLEGFNAGSLALLRFLAASLLMTVLLFRSGKPKIPSFREGFEILILGIIGFSIYNLALNQGELTVDPGATSFLMSQVPVFMVMLSIIFLGEKINFIRATGILISISGISMVALGKSQIGNSGIQLNIGILYLLLAALSHAVYSILNKPYLKKFTPIEFTTYTMWGGTIALLFYAPSLSAQLPHAPLSAIIAAIYIGIFPAAVGYLTWSYALHHRSASEVGSVLYALPIITSLQSWLFLNEIPTMLSLCGGCIALMGAIIVSRSDRMKFTKPRKISTLKSVGESVS